MRVILSCATLVVLGSIVPGHAAVTISSAATQNMTCTAGVCAPTATDAVLNTADLENYISQNGNVQVTTTGSGVQAGSIIVDGAISWSQASVTLNAQASIVVNAPISVGQQTSELEIQIASGNGPGLLTFGQNGQISFGSLSDIFGIDGGIFTLVNSIQGLASAVAANAGGSIALASSYNAKNDGTYRASPVGTAFTGYFEGLGNTISNLSVSVDHLSGAAGLFSAVDAGGVIENVRLEKIAYNIRHYYNAFVGGLVAGADGILFGDHVSGYIDAHDKLGRDIGIRVGGLISQNNGSITKCSAGVRVLAPHTGKWGAQNTAGGLAGFNEGSISLSYATGDVSGGLAGGLVGFNTPYTSVAATIDQSWSSGKVIVGAQGGAGDLVGANDNDDNHLAAIVTNSYATGSVTQRHGFGYAGGLVGENVSGNEQEQTSYSTGRVHGTHRGGLIGIAIGQMTSDYWDKTTSATHFGDDGRNVSGVTGLTTKQLRSGLPEGFDPQIWAEKKSINGGLPYLIANPPAK